MDYAQRSNIEQELAKNYPNLQNAFYTGKLSSEGLTNYVTQPFWNSVVHSKKCINRSGARVECTQVGRIKQPRLLSSDSQDEIEVKNYQQKVVERKKVFFNNRCIYRKKDRKIYNTSVINVAMDPDADVICPNCGAKGKMHTFIDGCDFCNTKFMINTNINKISSFSSMENTKGKIGRLFGKLLAILGISALVLGIAIVAIFIAVIFFQSSIGWYKMPNFKTELAKYFMLALGLFPEILKIIFITLVLFGIIGFIFLKNSYKRIRGDYIIRNFVREIVPEEFAQNIEHKLRAIHYANNLSEVAVFASTDLTKVVNNYNDIIECSMNEIHFLDTGRSQYGVWVDVEVTLNNLRLIGERVKEETERVKLRLFAREDMVEQKYNTLVRHNCPGCGNSIDLFNGGVCSSCGTQIDYAKYNWLIQSYESLGKVPNVFSKVKLMLVGIYFAIIILFTGIFVANHRIDVDKFLHLNDLYEEASGQFEEIDSLDEVCEDAMLVDSERYDIIWIDKYETEYVEDDVDSYQSYLWTIGFDEVDENEKGTGQYDNVVKLTRHHNFENMYLDEEVGTQIVIIEYDDGGKYINIIFDVE